MVDRRTLKPGDRVIWYISEKRRREYGVVIGFSEKWVRVRLDDGTLTRLSPRRLGFLRRSEASGEASGETS